MDAIPLLDGTLKLRIFYELSDREFEDDICIRFVEDCNDDEKLFRADEVNIYLTPHEAGLLILELNRVIEEIRLAGHVD